MPIRFKDSSTKDLNWFLAKFYLFSACFPNFPTTSSRENTLFTSVFYFRSTQNGNTGNPKWEQQRTPNQWGNFTQKMAAKLTPESFTKIDQNMDWNFRSLFYHEVYRIQNNIFDTKINQGFSEGAVFNRVRTSV